MQEMKERAHRVAIGRSFLRLPKLGTGSRIRTPRCSFACKRSHLFKTGQNASIAWGIKGRKKGKLNEGPRGLRPYTGCHSR